MLAVSVRDLSKRFGPIPVLDKISLDVPAGSIYGLLGVNGSGKTTLLRLLMGFLRPTGGAATLLGEPLGQLDGQGRSRLAYVPEQPALYSGMRVREVLAFVRSLHPRWDSQAAARYLQLFRLPTERRVGALSTGMRSQLALAIALACRPELLLIDEPAAGLDPIHRRRYLQLLLEESFTPDRTILFASQDLSLVERACDHVALLHEQHIRVAGPMEDVLTSEKRLLVTAPSAAEERLRALPGVRTLRAEGHGFLITGAVQVAAVRGLPDVKSVQVFDLSLDDLFWSYVED